MSWKQGCGSVGQGRSRLRKVSSPCAPRLACATACSRLTVAPTAAAMVVTSTSGACSACIGVITRHESEQSARERHRADTALLGRTPAPRAVAVAIGVRSSRTPRINSPRALGHQSGNVPGQHGAETAETARRGRRRGGRAHVRPRLPNELEGGAASGRQPRTVGIIGVGIGVGGGGSGGSVGVVGVIVGGMRGSGGAPDEE
eukprot:scaffold133457_cov58-Phaeocystis_antarctica.AAC.2